MSGYGYAFSLTKQEVKNATPPGTSVLVEHELARTRSGRDNVHDEIILVPQPSADPADPLNFPMWRKLLALNCAGAFAFVNNFASSSISSALPLLAIPGVFGPAPVPFSRLTYLISVNILMQGAANLWWVPLANVFGRRTILLVSLLMLALCSMWAGLVQHDFYNLLAARLFMGIGGAPSDTVSPQIVGDLFFVHQRGRAMAVYTGWLALGSLLGGLSGGYIIASGGFGWIHWANVTMSAIVLFFTFWFVPETLYKRSYSTPAQTPADVETHKMKASEFETVKETGSHSSYRPYTFGQALKVGTLQGNLGREFLALLRPLALPGAWLVALWYAGLVGGIVSASTVGPTLVSEPPYLWGRNAGLINVGPIIGTVLGSAYTYFLSDWTTKYLAKRDVHGYSEPESRLWTALPGLFLATFGLLTFGFSAASPGGSAWVGLEFGGGMLAFGLMQAPSIGFNYLIEAYTVIAGDCFVVVVIVRAIIAFCWTFFVGTWVTEDGAAEPFGIFGMLMGIFGLLTIPVIVFGKRTRIATAKWLPKY